MPAPLKTVDHGWQGHIAGDVGVVAIAMRDRHPCVCVLGGGSGVEAHVIHERESVAADVCTARGHDHRHVPGRACLLVGDPLDALHGPDVADLNDAERA